MIGTLNGCLYILIHIVESEVYNMPLILGIQLVVHTEVRNVVKFN